MDTLASDLQFAMEKARKIEEKSDRISFSAYILLRTLGWSHEGEIGVPTTPGFLSKEEAIHQLLAALKS